MPQRIRKQRLGSGIFIARFETQYGLASTFLRIQEHYESSRFAGRVFTLEQYMDWYAERFGAFTYFDDWVGFNVPSGALRPFYGGAFDPLLAKERRLLRLFEREPEPFYVIGLARNASRRDLAHELAHALFHTDAAYRRSARAAMGRYDTSALEAELTRLGYARRVIEDEVHAYLVAPGDLRPARAPRLAPLRAALRRLFGRYRAALGLPTVS